MTTRAEVRAGHAARLRENQHVRYMWIPYTDCVVVVRSNPITAEEERDGTAAMPPPGETEVEPLVALLAEVNPAGLQVKQGAQGLEGRFQYGGFGGGRLTEGGKGTG